MPLKNKQKGKIINTYSASNSLKKSTILDWKNVYKISHFSGNSLQWLYKIMPVLVAGQS